MSAEAAFVRTWPVGRFTVTMSAPKPRPGSVSHVSFEWDPVLPTRLSEAEREQYRAGRDAAMRDFADETGLRLAVVET